MAVEGFAGCVGSPGQSLYAESRSWVGKRSKRAAALPFGASALSAPSGSRAVITRAGVVLRCPVTPVLVLVALSTHCWGASSPSPLSTSPAMSGRQCSVVLTIALRLAIITTIIIVVLFVCHHHHHPETPTRSNSGCW